MDTFDTYLRSSLEFTAHETLIVFMIIRYRQIPCGFYHVLSHHFGGLGLEMLMDLTFVIASVIMTFGMGCFLLPSFAILGGMLGTLILTWKCNNGGISHHNPGKQLSVANKIE